MGCEDTYRVPGAAQWVFNFADEGRSDVIFNEGKMMFSGVERANIIDYGLAEFYYGIHYHAMYRGLLPYFH